MWLCVHRLGQFYKLFSPNTDTYRLTINAHFRVGHKEVPIQQMWKLSFTSCSHSTVKQEEFWPKNSLRSLVLKTQESSLIIVLFLHWIRFERFGRCHFEPLPLYFKTSLKKKELFWECWHDWLLPNHVSHLFLLLFIPFPTLPSSSSSHYTFQSANSAIWEEKLPRGILYRERWVNY